VLQRGVNEIQEEDRTKLADIYDMFNLEFEDLCETKYEFRHQQQKWLEEGYGLLLSLSTTVIVKFVGWNVSKYNF
jgi:hypothetical protein